MRGYEQRLRVPELLGPEDEGMICSEAHAWLAAGAYTTMREAWDACPNGCWMAYWLVGGVDNGKQRVGYTVLHKVARAALGAPPESKLTWGIYNGEDMTGEQRRVLADAIRERYTWTGERR